MRILVVDDDEAVRFALEGLLAHAGHDVTTAAHAPAALAAVADAVPDLVLTDLRMPQVDGLALLELLQRDQPGLLVALLTAHGDERTAVRALQAGAFGYLPKPFDNDEVLALVQRAREVVLLRSENARLAGADAAGRAQGLLGESAAMHALRQRLARVAETSATVLLRGESGTGKELAARFVHAASARRARPFVAINCSAIPGELLESELFGHRKGAFTGAVQDREGLMAAADGGTLFLDEVGDLAPAAQAKLLRALESGEVMPVGATAPQRIDVRLVTATHQPLERLVAAGRFREDLLFRLAVVTVELPPLRARREDVPLLAAHFAAEAAARHGRPARGFDAGARAALLAHPWPGNVRELRHAVERAVVLGEGPLLTRADLPALLGPTAEVRSALEAAMVDEPFVAASRRARQRFERAFLAAALERHGGNVSRTAEAIGLHRSTLQKLLARHGLRAGDRREAHDE